MISDLLKDLERHEGLRLKVYDDATGKEVKTGDTIKGKLTIGIGRNLQDKGISEIEAKRMLMTDVDYFYKQVTRDKRVRHTFGILNNTRQRVILNMVFNMGLEGVVSFKKMWAALEHKDYNEAAFQMLDSKWAKQVGKRADELAQLMRIGE